MFKSSKFMFCFQNIKLQSDNGQRKLRIPMANSVFTVSFCSNQCKTIVNRVSKGKQIKYDLQVNLSEAAKQNRQTKTQTIKQKNTAQAFSYFCSQSYNLITGIVFV